MQPLYGYGGSILRVNLSKPEFIVEEEDTKVMQKYLGGTSFGAKIIYDEIPASTEWSAPENRIILAAGPLSGTRVKGSGTFSFITKGAMSYGSSATQANGNFSAFLKFAGFDAVVIEGRAQCLSYLYIHNGRAELREAKHLAGKDTWETEDFCERIVNLAENNHFIAFM